MPQRGRPVDELLESDDAGRPSRRGAWADVVECQGPAHGVEQRVRLAQNSDELADVLRTALDMVRADKGHDVFTLLDVLAQDRFPGMSRDACYQVARAVLRYLAGAEAMEAREPVPALHLWHLRHRDAVKSEMTSERALAETVGQVDGSVSRRPGR